MKSGIAGFLVAMRLLAEVADRWEGAVVAHLVPDEEPGGRLGTEALLKLGLIKGDATILAEPSELTVYRAQKGNVFTALRVPGKAAHGAMPDHGVNAISRAARLVIDLEDTLRLASPSGSTSSWGG